MTDGDGPSRLVYINPEYVATVEQDMAKPEQISHITLVSGHDFRINESATSANNRLLGAI
jgi:hypothetical protein